MATGSTRRSGSFNLDVDSKEQDESGEESAASTLVPTWMMESDNASQDEFLLGGPATVSDLLDWPETVHARADGLGLVDGSSLDRDIHVLLTTHYSGAGTAETACKHIEALSAPVKTDFVLSHNA